MQVQFTSTCSLDQDTVVATVMLSAIRFKLGRNDSCLPPSTWPQLHEALASPAVTPNAFNQAPVPLFYTFHHARHDIEIMGLVVAAVNFDAIYFEEFGGCCRNLFVIAKRPQFSLGLDCGIVESRDCGGSHRQGLIIGAFTFRSERPLHRVTRELGFREHW